MSFIKKTTVALIASSFLSAHLQAETGINVGCQVESESFLSPTSDSQLIGPFLLYAERHKEGGKYTMLENDKHLLEVKSYSWMKQGADLKVTAFSISLLDKANQTLIEASSSTNESPRIGTLTAFKLDNQLKKQNRLIVTCIES